MLFLQGVPPNPAAVTVNLPVQALPWPILAILLAGFFAVIILIALKANWFKGYMQDFPTQTTTIATGLSTFVMTVMVSLCRGALGLQQFDGVEFLLGAELTMAGVGGALLGVKRFSSSEFKEGQAKIEAAKASAAPALQPPQVLAASGSAVNVSTEAQPVPQAGVRPQSPEVRRPLEELAARQRALADDDTPEAS